MIPIAFLWLTAPATGGFGASFETGVTVSSGGGAHLINADPVIVRIAGGRLVLAFSVMPKDNPDGYIGATISGDGGKTSALPVKGLNIPGKLDADTSLMWDGQRVSIFSTTVPAKHTLIESSPMFMATSADGSEWTAPREIELPFAYSVGKHHMVVRLIDGSYAIPISWDLWAQRGTAACTEGEMDLASGVLKNERRPTVARHLLNPCQRAESHAIRHRRRVRTSAPRATEWRFLHAAAHQRQFSL